MENLDSTYEKGEIYMRKKTCLAVLAAGAMAVLAGCGGVVSDSGDAEGAWYALDGNSSTQIVILRSGSLWGIYGANPTVAGIQGMLHGTADTYTGDCIDYGPTYSDDEGNVSGGDCDDWIEFPTASGSLTQFDMSGSASPAIKWYFSGQAKEAATLAITLLDNKNKDKAENSRDLSLLYDNSYDTAASVATFAGTYAGWTAVAGQARHNLTGINIFGSTLSLPSDDTGCAATGTLTPHKGKASSTGDWSSKTTGVMDVALTFTGAGCPLGDGTTVQGLTIPPSRTVNGSAQLQIVATTDDKQNGFMLVANRQ